MLSSSIFNDSNKKTKEKENHLFLSIGGVMLSKQKSKQLALLFGKSRFLSKEKLKKLEIAINKERRAGIELLKKIVLSLPMARKLMNLLLKSGLKMRDIKLVLSFLKNLLKNLFKRPFDIDSISSLMSIWNKIPLEIKRLIVAIIELKKEILHKFMLDLHRNQKRIQKLNRNIGRVRNIASSVAEKDPMPLELEMIGNGKKNKKKGEILNIEDGK